MVGRSRQMLLLRAHLKHCLDKLKALVPLAPNSTRHTTLGLLNRAKGFIKTLEQRDRNQRYQLEQLRLEHQTLRSQLNMWEPQFAKRRSVSESSSSSSGGASSSMESGEFSLSLLPTWFFGRL
ncbi:MXD1 [Cordylochernes scorpioides]|uniref:MXD1 n=1 Tax=Cordylochernes scorpioides TaxID=51811 RepID=A0ABY6KXH4_9ARAC|nr:MXD1 [Cordylochernes scorpioides]